MYTDVPRGFPLQCLTQILKHKIFSAMTFSEGWQRWVARLGALGWVGKRDTAVTCHLEWVQNTWHALQALFSHLPPSYPPQQRSNDKHTTERIWSGKGEYGFFTLPVPSSYPYLNISSICGNKRPHLVAMRVRHGVNTFRTQCLNAAALCGSMLAF